MYHLPVQPRVFRTPRTVPGDKVWFTMIQATTSGRGSEPEPCAASPSPPVAAAAIALLDQCDSFVRLVAGPAYTGQSRVLKGGTIGKHLRHSLDHFRAALDGADSGQTVDYDRRERNVPMESDPGAALAALSSLRARLAALQTSSLATPLRVRVMLTGDGEHADIQSTLGRELAFATHHAVHHNAMLGAIAAEFGIQADADFGKAPSTIRFERRSC